MTQGATTSGWINEDLVIVLYPWYADLGDCEAKGVERRAVNSIRRIARASANGPAAGGNVKDLRHHMTHGSDMETWYRNFGPKSREALIRVLDRIIETGEFRPSLSPASRDRAIARAAAELENTRPAKKDPKTPDPEIEKLSSLIVRLDARIARLERDFRAAEVWKKQYDDRVSNAIEDIRQRMDAIEAGEIGQSAQKTRSEHDQMIAQIKMMQASLVALERRIYDDE